RSLAVEASGRLVGPPVFKTGEGLKSPWRVRFPSASATASADSPGPMPSPRQRLRRCCGGFDSRPPPLLRRRTRLARCHLPASGFAGAVAGSIPVRLRYCGLTTQGIATDGVSRIHRLPTSDFRLSFPFASAPDVVSSAMGIEIVRGSDSLTISDEQLQRLAEESAIPVARLVEEPGDHTHATFESADGSYRASIPLEVALAQGVLLPEAGSWRLRVEDGATLCWNVKNLGRIR